MTKEMIDVTPEINGLLDHFGGLCSGTVGDASETKTGSKKGHPYGFNDTNRGLA